jgi:hypothetical protein
MSQKNKEEREETSMDIGPLLNTTSIPEGRPFRDLLEEEISRCHKRISALVACRDNLSRIEDPKAVRVATAVRAEWYPAATTADLVEQLIRELDPSGAGMHVDAIATEMRRRRLKPVSGKAQVSAKQLAGILGRWVDREKRFRRVAPNTFAVTNHNHSSDSGK